MSYCRNNGEDSDVYVIGTGYGLECCGCRLYKNSFLTRKYSLMIEHLNHHRNTGDKVPARAFARLTEEKKVAKDVYKVTDKSKPIKNIRKNKDEILEQRLYKEMGHHRKEMARTALEVFEDIYKRKPHSLELDGLAKTADISLDLYFGRVQN